jgi:exonuclease SbcC
MIPVSLKLKGIYSYKGEQEVDFTRLTEASIFGIFGSVGSGKSTILEAMGYAMYGETERMNRMEGRGYNMMNLAANDMYIELVFRCGEHDDTYMFTVTGKRNKKKFEDVGTHKRIAYIRKGNEWETLPHTDGEKIIGLSYENFRRTIIIPQGKFQEFLQLGDKARNNMMKQLFNLQAYDLFDKAAKLERMNTISISHLEGRMRELGEIQPEQLEEKKKTLGEAESALKELRKQQEEKEKAAHEFDRVKGLAAKKQDQEKKLQDLLKDEASYKTREEQLKQYEQCQKKFSLPLVQQEQALGQRKKINDSLEVLRAEEKTIKKTQGEKEIAFAKTREEFSKRELLKQRAEELGSVMQLFATEEEVKALDERIKKGDQVLKKEAEAVGTFGKQRESITKQEKELRGGQQDVVRLSEARAWYNKKNILEKALQQLRAEANELNEKMETLGQADPSLLAPGLKKLLPKQKIKIPLDKLGEHLTEVRDRLNKELKEAEDEQAHARLQEGLQKFSDALKDGEPCPLCGSHEHPQVLNVKDVKRLLDAVLKKKTELNNHIHEVDAALKVMGENNAVLAITKKAHEKLTERLKREELAFEQHAKSFAWADLPANDETAIEKAFILAAEQKKQEVDLGKQREALDDKIKTQEKKRDDARELLEKIKGERISKQSAVTTLAAQLKLLKADDLRGTAPEDLKAEAAKLLKQYTQLEKQYKEQEEELNGLREKANTVRGSINTAKQNLKETEQQIASVEQQLARLLAGSGYASIEKVKAVLQKKVDAEAERNSIEQYRKELHSAQEYLKNLVNELGKNTYNEEAHKQIQEELSGLKVKAQAHSDAVAAMKNELKNLEKNLEQLKALTSEMDKLRKREENIKTLKQLFTGGGFVNYISSVYLKNLCIAANERFYRLTGQRLMLEVAENNDFQVRDFLNNGHTRSVRTLSGGQTFQAALSLALALADNIQPLTRSKQNFFFLDEGFGSLDKENLQIVFETLKKLRKENRIVGVISHVEEMQQEIETHLKITNDEERGSVVKGSWERVSV